MNGRRITGTHYVSMLNRAHSRLFVAPVTVCVSGFRAQNYGEDPVPTWPGDRNSAAIPEGKFVFLTPDRHAIVVLVPQNKGVGIKGPKSPVTVPLNNDLKPSISVSALSSNGLFTYQYSRCERNGCARRYRLVYASRAGRGFFPRSTLRPACSRPCLAGSRRSCGHSFANNIPVGAAGPLLTMVPAAGEKCHHTWKGDTWFYSQVFIPAWSDHGMVVLGRTGEF